MMRKLLLGMLVCSTWACTHSSGAGETPNEAVLADCAAGQTVYFSKVSPPSAGDYGASGIAAAPAILTGSAPSGGGTGEGAPTTVGVDTPSTGAVGASTDLSSGSSSSSSTSYTGPYASTTSSCVPAVCPAGQVAVTKVSVTGGGSTAGSGDFSSGIGVSEGAPTSGIAIGGVAAPSTSPTPSSTPVSTPVSSTASSDPASTAPSASDVLCVAPPPLCESGEAPSFAPAGFWHCLPMCDASNPNLVVISYGGLYGNGGVCAGPPPPSSCPTPGQVWTWDYTIEDWSCETECNNGQYDQRTFGGQTVCVPC